MSTSQIIAVILTILTLGCSQEKSDSKAKESEAVAQSSEPTSAAPTDFRWRNTVTGEFWILFTKEANHAAAAEACDGVHGMMPSPAYVREELEEKGGGGLRNALENFAQYDRHAMEREIWTFDVPDAEGKLAVIVPSAPDTEMRLKADDVALTTCLRDDEWE